MTVNEVVAMINELTGKEIAPNYADARVGDVKHSLADIDLAKEIIGYQPIVPFREGLSLAVDWYRDYLL